MTVWYAAYNPFCRAHTTDTHPQSERWGYPTQPPPAAPVVWFAVSTIGEAAIALPLVQRVLQVHPGLHVLVTAASTPALALFDRSVRTDQVHLQMSPLDTPGAVKRFVSYWKPIAAAFVVRRWASVHFIQGTQPFCVCICKHRC